MNKEDYRILKELTSLRDKKVQIQAQIKGELSRIDKIESQRSHKKAQMEKLESDLKQLEKEMVNKEQNIRDLDDKIHKTETDLKAIIGADEQVKLQHQLEIYLHKREEMELKGLESLDQITNYSDEIEDLKNFLKGSLETIKEIEEDIKVDNADIYKDFQNIEIRIPNLESQLPEKLVEKYYQIASKTPKPLAEITPSNSCTQCRYLIPIAYVNKVEKEMKFTTCPGCTRILIPQSSKYL